MLEFLPFSKPSLDEKELAAVNEVLKSGWITTGPKCEQLEQEFCRLIGNKHAIAVSSATGGMHITLMALGLQSGDEVITPSYTWVSTINMIYLLGAKPVMIDVDHDTLMVTVELIKSAITSRTKAIIPVHYAGAPVDIDEIYLLSNDYGIPVIEDAAHAVGTEYKGRYVGAVGTAIFSFHAIKNMTCAEGGIVVTDNDILAQKIRILKFHGLDIDTFKRNTYSSSFHTEVIKPGYKYNLSDIHASIALVQLRKLFYFNLCREKIAHRYLRALVNIPVLPLILPLWQHKHVWHLFVIRIDEKLCGINRDDFVLKLKYHGIGTGLHFRAVHTQMFYRKYFSHLNLPVTEWNSLRVCSLPMYPTMKNDDIERVITALRIITKV